MTSDGSTPHMDSDEEELMRMRYFEALRRQHFEEQMRQMQLKERESSNKQPFRTPNVISFNYEDLYSYGSEVTTASANYRPGNSNTLLRRRKNPPKTISATKN